MVELWVNAKTGDDQNPGTKEKPLATPNAALSKVGGNNDLVHLEGTFYTGLRPKMTKYPGHVTFDGHDQTLLYGFEGPYQDFDPANPPARTYKALSIMDVHNLTVRNLSVWGGNSQAVSLDDSYPSVGIRNIHLENIKVRYGASRGIFMGGNNIEGIYIDNCEVQETCYGDTTHNIYLSGGHWNPDYPPIRKVRIRNTMCKYTGGRHDIQLNGRFDDVVITGNKLYHAELAGLSLIGCQNVLVAENEIYGNQRQGIVLYDYWDDHYFDITDPESVEKWKGCHHPNDRILIRNNTIFVGPTQWHKDFYHNNKPYKHGCILVNNNINDLGIPYRQHQIGFLNNVLVSPWSPILRFGGTLEAIACYAHGNLMWTEDEWKAPCIELPYGDGSYSIDWLQENAPKWYKDNVILDPQFVQRPEYQFVDRTKTPHFNFGVDHQTKADLYSQPAAALKKGKTYNKNLMKESNSNNFFKE